jgi:beta-glucanase (GH16 family)
MNSIVAKARSLTPSLSIAIGLVFGALAFDSGPVYGAWQLVWSDEFSQQDGSSPDSTKWGYDIGNGSSGWGNNEWEYYTSRTNNARIQNGQLVIEACKESYSGFNYTSARMLTKGKWSWAYGRMGASIKLPRGQGIWPAFWMLGTNIDSVYWPTCGETDIMENIGNTNDQGTAHGTIHGPQSGGDYNGGAGVGGTYTLPGGAALADNFHLFAVEWTTNQIKWFVDNVQYFTTTPSSLPSGATWVFTQPQFLILNLAVGGKWPGYPDATTVFPQQMLVDYVRVYKYVASPPDPPTGLTINPGNAKAFLSWDASTGAAAYNVKRATNRGGPYTLVASPVTNSYVDTGLNACASYYYVVSATNFVGESTNSSEAAAPLGAFALAVNCGGSAAGQFIADTNFTNGTAASTTATIDTSGVVGPAPQAVYQSERYGNFTYTFTGLTRGLNYTVRLHFAESYWTSVGQRRFNVFLNDTQVLTNFDIIAAAAAQNKATVQVFTTAANSSGQMIVQYATVTDNAKASGIEILLPPPAAPTGVNATAGDCQVALLWNTATGGATYNVKRSLVSGGPFTPVSCGLYCTNYADAGLTNDTTYYYVVSAVNAGCESTNSTQVSATPTCAPPPPPAVANNGPLWSGMTLNLTASTVSGATYTWTGPNGFTSTNQNPSIASATKPASGLYSVVATVGPCTSAAATTSVTVNPPASISLECSSTNLTIKWPSGTLQSATNIAGPWSDVFQATSPWPVTLAEPQEFYRVKFQ